MTSTAELASVGDFTFRVDDLPPDHLKVTAFSGTEAISELFRFDVTLCSQDADLAPAEMLGKACTLRIATAQGPRFVNGIVRRFGCTGQGVSLTHYRAEVVPAHWLLTRRFQSRIFQPHNCPDMTVGGVIRRVLADAGIPDDQVEFLLHAEYAPREVVVQYRESDMDFASRLMESEGIFYFFKHTDTSHTLVIADANSALVGNELGEAQPFRHLAGMSGDEEFIHAVSDEREIGIGAVSLADFDFKKPGANLLSSAQAGQFTSLERFDWPGGYADREAGERYARLRLESHQAAAQRTDMRGTVRGLVPGFLFTLEDHPTARLNRGYVVTQIAHRATQSQSGQEEQAGEGPGATYEAELRAIPTDVPFRPEAKTPQPVVRGAQTAIVVGPESEEIQTDEYGRVRVQFHWDREGAFGENASALIRVSQQMAGGRYGAMFLPRVGQEVIVDFLEGNPDRPIIVGRVYNGDLMPPYPLPGDKATSCLKSHSTPGGGGCNEIRFDDRKGKEQLLIQAENRMDTRAKGSHFHTASSYHLHVGGKTETGELYGEVRDMAFKKRHVLTHGDVHEEVGGTLYQNYFGDHLLSVHGAHQQLLQDFRQWALNHRQEVTDTFHSSAMNMKFEADAVIELSCGASSIVLRPEGVYIHGPMVYVNSGPGAPAPPFEPRDLMHEPAETPSVADRSKPGRDVRYDGVVVKMPPLDLDELDERRSFIEIQIVDASDEEKGVANERVLIKLPSGEIREAVTDGDGLVRIDDVEVGTVEFQLPDRGDHEWRFLRLGPAGASGAEEA